jgi:hypothetical protein
MLTAVTRLQSAGNDWDAVSQDDLVIYFNRDADLYGATRDTDAEPFSNIEALSELNTEAEETDPWLSLDGKTLLFASNRDGAGALYEARHD